MSNTIGIDIGGTRLRAARIGSGGVLEARLSELTDRNPVAALAQIQRLAGELRNSNTRAVGIGVPGRVNGQTGDVLSGGYVDFSGLRLAETLKAAFALPVCVDNDANMALIAEAQLGAAKGFAHVVMLTIGTGIGGALMLDGKIVHGHMAAGQLGHITVDIHGETCLCGRRGCFETVSSGTALRQFIASAGFAPATSIEDLLASSDAKHHAVLAQWTKPLRAGIDSLIATLDPEIIVLGGGLGGAACKALERFPAQSHWYRAPVSAAKLGDDAGMIGAGLSAAERLR